MKQNNKYKYIFFDLDHTLWDFEKNSTETLAELYHKYELAKLGTFCVNSFIARFQEINAQLWRQSDEGKVDRDSLRKNRFRMICDDLGFENEEVTSQMGVDYVALCPQKKELLPFALDMLEYLNQKYALYILTNGFSDVQAVKLSSAGILHYFQRVFTAEDFGVGKPNKTYFYNVMREIGARPEECIMIGDNLKTDILGAQNAGLDHVFYNPGKRSYFMHVQYDIECLSELGNLL